MPHRGYLKDYFEGVGVKTLSVVDATTRSNQHEIGITLPMRKFMGKTFRKFDSTFIWLGGEQESITEYGVSTYYDTRENNPNRPAEWRLYYPSNSVTTLMSAGDTFFLALRPDNNLLFIIVPAQTTLESQMLWLFGISEQQRLSFVTREYGQDSNNEIDFAARYLLDEIGIEYEDPNANTLDSIIDRFGLTFPKTKIFSDLARNTLTEVNAIEDPDLALLAWLNHEEAMFRRLENRIVAQRIGEGFVSEGEADVDDFIKFSLSVQNRRKSRMGHSLENHISAILDIHQVRYSSQVKTEKGKKPDYIFPGKDEYADLNFPNNSLSMLATKSSCKDRWSQILPEAERIKQKHLLTLEPAISVSTTATMSQSNVQLIVPTNIQSSYTSEQQSWLYSFQDFISLVKSKQ